MFGHPTPILRTFARSLREKDLENARPGEPQLQDRGAWEITIQDPASNRLTFHTEAKN